MFKKFRFATAVMGMALAARFNMSDADAAASAPDAMTAPDADVSIDVPAAHASLFERIVALLKKDEQTIVDNVHAGVSALEAMFGITPPVDDAQKLDAAADATE